MEKTMETASQNGQESDVIKQLLELLEQQNMKEQSQDFMELFRFAAGMQVQLSVMTEELQNVKGQLAELKSSQPQDVQSSVIENVAQLEEKTGSLSEKLSDVKNHLVQIAKQAVNVFKEKGKQEMGAVLQKGIANVQKMLSGHREKLTDLLVDAEKTANQIDSIGDELKQIGNSAVNVGRLIAGKGTKEVSEEKPGVALTRLINAPVKKNIANLKRKIGHLDKITEKLEQTSARFEPKKGTEKKAGKEKDGRVSVKEKLSEMKEKSGQQTSKPEKAKQKENSL